MLFLILYWALMIIFYFVACKLRAYKDRFSFMEDVFAVIIYMLVFLMGLRMGSNQEIMSNLTTIGVQSLIVTAITVFGSMFFVFLTRKTMGLNRLGIPDDEKNKEEKTEANAQQAAEAEEILMAEKKQDLGENSENNGSGIKTSLIIFAVVILGLLVGYFVVPKIFVNVDTFQEMSSTWLTVGICILLSLVGFNLGLSGTVFKNMKRVGFKAVFIPFAAVAGSLVAGLVYGLISDFSIGEAVAISAGFGWYTLAPNMIGEAGFAVASAVSFLHNVIRETLGIIIIPLAAQKIGYIEATAIPGVSAMDGVMGSSPTFHP